MNKYEGEMPEFSKRMELSLMKMVAKMALRESELPETVLAVRYEPEMGDVFYLVAKVLRINPEKGVVQVYGQGLHQLPTELSIVKLIDIQVKLFPDVPIVCNSRIAAEITQDSTRWIDEDHYQVLGRDQSIIELYVEHSADYLPKNLLPPGTTSNRVDPE